MDQGTLPNYSSANSACGSGAFLRPLGRRSSTPHPRSSTSRQSGSLRAQPRRNPQLALGHLRSVDVERVGSVRPRTAIAAVLNTPTRLPRLRRREPSTPIPRHFPGQESRVSPPRNKWRSRSGLSHQRVGFRPYECRGPTNCGDATSRSRLARPAQILPAHLRGEGLRPTGLGERLGQVSNAGRVSFASGRWPRGCMNGRHRRPLPVG